MNQHQLGLRLVVLTLNFLQNDFTYYHDLIIYSGKDVLLLLIFIDHK